MSRNLLLEAGAISEVLSDSKASLAKWLSVRLRTKWLWIRIRLLSLKTSDMAPALSKEFPDIQANYGV